MICPVCRVETLEDASFCHHCGAKLGGESGESAPREAMRSAANRKASDDTPERELWQGSYSKLAMIGAWFGAAVLSIALLLWAALGGFSGSGWLVILGLIALLWIMLILRLLYLQLSRHYYLTNQRFSHERGLLWRQIDRIETIDIDDVSFTQGPVERMLGVGTIRIMSSDQTDPATELPGIEDVRAVASMIDDARRQERRKRGLYVESV